MIARYIDANALIDYANNQIDQTITANDIARFPTAIDIKWHYPSRGELPRLNVRVLVYNGYGLTIAHRWNFNWHDERGEIINCDIIAWQYLPEPPKEM